MSVSILIPSYDRNDFKKLIEYNINIQDYNNIKEVIIFEDGRNKPLLTLDLENKNIKVITHYIEKITIGDKRNKLIKKSSGKYSIFMDTDDIYFKNYISSSIDLLKKNNKKITGSADMLFYFTSFKKTGYMRCKNLDMMHEATLCGETKFLKTLKFKNSNSGEGVDFLKGFNKYLIEGNIFNIMVCIEHKNNTIDKKIWYNENNNINLNIDEHLKILSSLNI